ncbi:uncharacterized protein [Lepeophtheirus salmonis]|nr:uncharacterized protein LOC121122106 [Lepeophtheirus salmonis]XP_040573049.1 uncharacterized protein LOC121122106 [Lepeophtheirus salmonis]XP_040573050.1 uncharacterized protein LOC121122106 [Lepeophtheirus salmonis]XP_040573051.1 uncharacterized protein LOC121122106 [Lepeophtheirus salmonis]
MSAESALVSTAMDFLARASSTSEVLTLNLTNLLILILLKGIIVAFALFGAFGNGKARSSDNTPASIKQSDLTGGMCFMMYASGDVEKLSCIQRSACEDPKTASDYLTAAKMWYKIHKLMKIVPFDGKYFDIISSIEEASNHSLDGGDCGKYEW